MRPVLRDTTRFLTLAVILLTIIASSCKSKSEPQQSQNTTQPPPAQQQGIDDLVAPVALYPDQLLAQVLTTAVNPQEVLDLGNWLLQNQNLQGDAMTSAARQAGFSASAQYLALFPQVVDNMCQQMDWTRQLGEAFKADQKGVMDAVQRKRAEARQLGNLTSSPQMAVDTQTAGDGKSYVEIKPTDPKVVYVPQYNPVTIYNTTAPAAPAPTTTTTTEKEEKSGVSGGEAAAIGLLSFGIGMAVGSAINNDYYPYPAWGYHGVYVAGRPYYPAAYRAPVYAGYRPAYGYRAPANYRWNQYNRNVNATINNNYYNRFNNRNTNTTRTNMSGAYNNPNRAANTRPSQNQANWRGQSTYQGARSTGAQGQRAGNSMANAIPRNQQYGQQRSQGTASRANADRNTMAANRPGAGSLSSSNMANRSASANLDRSTASERAATRQPAPSSFDRGGDRGYASSSATRAPDSASSRSGSAGGAFGGGSASGRQERAASSRGHSSMSSRSGGRRR